MCGRYQNALDPAELVELHRIQHEAWGRPAKLPNWNVAPRQSVPVIVRDAAGERAVVTMRWGFPPLWVARDGKDPFDAPPLVNAKAEEAAQKPTWKKALRERRCVVPTTGFYEWETVGGERRPLWFRPAHGRVLRLAGVWGAFDWGERKAWPCVAILTCAPSDDIAHVHDRMPVILPDEEAEAAWLAEGPPPMERCVPAPTGTLVAQRVSAALNSREAEGPGVLEVG